MREPESALAAPVETTGLVEEELELELDFVAVASPDDGDLVPAGTELFPVDAVTVDVEPEAVAVAEAPIPLPAPSDGESPEPEETTADELSTETSDEPALADDAEADAEADADDSELPLPPEIAVEVEDDAFVELEDPLLDELDGLEVETSLQDKS